MFQELTKHLSAKRSYWLEDSEFRINPEFIQIFIKHLLCAMPRSRLESKVGCKPLLWCSFYILEGTNNQICKTMGVMKKKWSVMDCDMVREDFQEVTLFILSPGLNIKKDWDLQWSIWGLSVPDMGKSVKTLRWECELSLRNTHTSVFGALWRRERVLRDEIRTSFTKEF